MRVISSVIVASLLALLPLPAQAICDPPLDIVNVQLTMGDMPLVSNMVMTTHPGPRPVRVWVSTRAAVPECRINRVTIGFQQRDPRVETTEYMKSIPPTWSYDRDTIGPLYLEVTEQRDFGQPGKWQMVAVVYFVPRDHRSPQAENGVSGSLPFYLDMEWPQLRILSPAENSVFKSGQEFEIEVAADDDLGFRDFIISVDGTVYRICRADAAFKPRLTQRLRATVTGRGSRMIGVLATDAARKQTEKGFRVYSDDAAPQISNIWPPPASLSDPHRLSLSTHEARVAARADVVDVGQAGVKEVWLVDNMGRTMATRTRPYSGTQFLFEVPRPASGRTTSCHLRAFDNVGNVINSNMINIVWEEPRTRPPAFQGPVLQPVPRMPPQR